MSWKSDLMLGDLAPDASIEATCRRCGKSAVRTAAEIATPSRVGLRLDDLERRLVCPDRTCRGRMRIALEHQHLMSGFSGGMA